MRIKRRLNSGFTIVELLIVMVIIGILAGITLVVYTGIQARAHDVSVVSDLDRLDALETNYGIKHNNGGKAYYSVDGSDSELSFVPSGGNVVRVVVNATDFCIRGYNVNGTKNSIDNAAIRESTPGVCSTLVAIDLPPAPTMLVGPSGGNIQGTITPVACDEGTPQYEIRSRTNDGTWTSYTDWSSTLTSSQTGNEGVKYGYQAQARCYIDDALFSPGVEGSEITYTKPVNPPTTPVITVALNGGNAQATVTTAAVCTFGTVQYGFNNRINDGSWAGYSAWSSTTTASQTANEGVKYGYQAQARCYSSSILYSVPTIGSEATYIKPITSVPTAPTVSSTTPNWSTTTYSWTTPTCPSGTSARYQYDFTTTYGYDSGWVSYASTSIDMTTSSSGYTYTMAVQAQCYNSNASGSWGSSGSANYYRPYTVQVLVIAGGAGGGAGDSYGNGGGGGAGGYIYNASYAVAAQAYSVTVGNGGGGGGSASAGGNGGSSVFGTLSAVGGGGGGGGTNNTSGFGGGSGGGASGSSTSSRGGSGGTAGQGNGGGNACSDDSRGSGGGGGATGAGGANAGCSNNGTTGGAGYTTSISGSSVCYAGGGGGGVGSGSVGSGSCGGGGGNSGGAGGVATANTGSGGGGGKGGGGAGGKGIVIIRYPTGAFTATGGTVTTSGTDTINTFYSSGTFTIN